MARPTRSSVQFNPDDMKQVKKYRKRLEKRLGIKLPSIPAAILYAIEQDSK